MNKRLWLIIAALAVVVGGAVAFGLLRGETEERAQQANVDSQQPTASAPLSQPGESVTDYAQKGTYSAYSAESLNKAAGMRRVIFFHAAWCPQCQQLDADINKQNVPAGMTILKANYDTETALKQQYGVTQQTTIIEIDAAGALIKKHVAYDDPTMAGILKALGS